MEVFKLRLVTAFFFVGFVVYMALGFSASAQSIDGLQDKISNVKDMAVESAAEIRSMQAQIDRNSSDVRTLSASVTDLAAAMNKVTGIGIAIGALGGIIVVLQSVSIVRKAGGK